MASFGTRSLTPKLHVKVSGPRGVSIASASTRARSPLRERCRGVEVVAFEQARELLAADAAEIAPLGRDPARHRDQHLIADRVAIGLVDALEVVDVQHHGRERAARVGAVAGLDPGLEEGAPVERAGERIRGGETDQLALHPGEPLGGAQPRIELLGAGGLPI